MESLVCRPNGQAIIAKFSAGNHSTPIQTGSGTMFITHDFAVLAHATTHCYVLDEGRIVESGRTADVLASPRDERTRRLVGAARELTLHAGDAGDKEQSS